MTLGELKEELALYVQDDEIATHFKGFLNNAVLEIANDFNLPALKLKEPVDLVCTESNWLYALPNSYLKNLYKCYDSDYNKITIKSRLGELDALDVEHTETADHITHVSVRDTQIGVYPMSNETIKLWYYKEPTNLSDDSDELTCIPKQYHSRVVISKVIIKAYHLLLDMTDKPPHQSLSWWKSNYNSGLYGSPNGDIGMLNCFARDKKPRRHGGRDPIC